MPSRPARVGLLLSVAGACSSTAEPDGDTQARIALTVRRGAASPVALAVDSVALQFEPLDSGSVTTVTAGAGLLAGADSVRLGVVIPMAQDVASLLMTVDLLADGALTFQTRSHISVRRGQDAELRPVEPATWQELAAASAPPPRQFTAVALAPTLGGTVLFAGLTATGNDGSTWVFDGGTWTLRQFPDPTPSGRHGHAMAFAESTNEIVMFGGRVATIAPVAETWVLGVGGWVQAQPATSPPPRTAHAMVYDPRRDVIVLFGGVDVQGPLGDTWLWDGASWQESGDSGGPAARSGHSLVWSPVRQRVILFGGSAGDGVRSDVWEWDGGRWQPHEVHGGIPPRRHHAAAWDGGRGRMIVLGGVEVAGVPLDDMWELIDDRWLPVEHAVKPARRFGPSMVETGTNGVFLFGGRTGEGLLNDLWLYR